MEKALAGAAVFLAVVCGKPDLLGIFCLYLIAALVVAGTAIHFLKLARRA